MTRWALVLALVAGCQVERIEHGAGTGAPANLCEGRVADFAPHPLQPAERPALGVGFRDPVFGTTLRRITSAAPGQEITPLSSALPSWNADESLLLLALSGNEYQLFDGRTYAARGVLSLPAASTGHVYWHPTDPDVLFVVRRTTREVLRYSVASTRLEAVSPSHPQCADDLISGPSYSSWDGRVLGVLCTPQAGPRRIGAWFDGGFGPLVDSPSYEAPSASPSGRVLVHEGTVYAPTMEVVSTLALEDTSAASCLGLGVDGGDVHYGVSTGVIEGSIVARPLDGAAPIVLIGRATGAPFPPSGTEVSAIALRRPTWVLASSVGSMPLGQEPLDNELYLADASKPGVMCRLAHSRSTVATHAALSPSGTRAVFASDWGDGSGPVDTYVLEIAPSER